MAAPTPDGTVTTFASASTATSHSFSHNNDSTGSNIVLCAFGFSNAGNNTAFTGTTYNGVSMSQDVSVAGAFIGGGVGFFLAAPASGSNNVVVSASTARHCNMGVFQLQDAIQSSFIDTTGSNQNNASATSQTNSVTTTVDNSTIFFWVLLNATTSARTPDSGETEIFDFDGSGNNDDMALSYFVKATAGSETMGYSWTTSTAVDSFITSIKEAPAAVASTRPTRHFWW